MTTIDLDRVQEAMDFLAETPDGDQALAGLAEACENLRKAIPVELNNAEMRYILERLMQQRTLDGWADRTEDAEVSGFAQQPYAGLYPQSTGVGRAQLPEALSNQMRVANFGFLIKANVVRPNFRAR